MAFFDSKTKKPNESPLNQLLARTGQMPRVSLTVRPIDNRPSFEIRTFLSYSFSSSIIIPVDTFTFSFTNPADDSKSFMDFAKEGDIVLLRVEDTVLSTGIIDGIDIETTEDGGEVVSVTGRDLMSQLEDQTSVSISDDPLYGSSVSMDAVLQKLIGGTRIQKRRLQGVQSITGLLATEPGETKLTSLQRFIEPFNVLSWMDPDGTIVIGKPNMSQDPRGMIILDKQRRRSNVRSMKAIRNSTQIPNIVIPMWTGQETIQTRTGKDQRFYNLAEGPARIRRAGHLVTKSFPVSLPNGSDPQSLSEVNRLQAGGSNLFQALAKREVARANLGELTVQAVVPGHMNDDAQPFQADQVYQVYYPRGGIDEKMYLYSVEYGLDADRGCRTTLGFCRLGALVADNGFQITSTSPNERVRPV